MTLLAWPIGHIGCNLTTCPNGKCQQTGECQDAPARIAASPPLAPCGSCAEICEFCGPDDPRSRAAPPRTIIAFTGLAGAGKSTAAAHLVSKHGFQRVRFAGPLKAMMAALGLTQEEIEGHLKETPCALLGGKTPRYAMQTVGTEWGRDLIDSDLWIRAWQAALAKVPVGVGVVVDDCRFPNEAAAVQAAGGVLVRIERPNAVTASGYQHSSETHALSVAHTIWNARDEARLRGTVDQILFDLSWAGARV